MPLPLTWISPCLGAALLVTQATNPLDRKSTAPTNPKSLKGIEDSMIEAGRRDARRRPIAVRKPLLPEETTRVNVFKKIRSSVLNITAVNIEIDNQLKEEFRRPVNTGTAFVWDEQGHVVTNSHVVTTQDNGQTLSEAAEFDAKLSDGRTYKARVIGRSITYDIAVLKVFAPLKDMKPIPLGSAQDLQVGQSVLAIGSPFGLDQTMTAGIVSALGREVVVNTSDNRIIRNMIQTDAQIHPGNSGGPLLDTSGRLIGMNTAIASNTNGNIGFAIPVTYLNLIVPRLLAEGHHERPDLGFTPLEAARFGQGKGLLVTNIVKGSPAEASGLRAWVFGPQGALLQRGDIILSMRGKAANKIREKTLSKPIEFLDTLELLPPSAPIEFDVLRDGQPIKITLQPKQEDDKTRI